MAAERERIAKRDAGATTRERQNQERKESKTMQCRQCRVEAQLMRRVEGEAVYRCPRCKQEISEPQKEPVTVKTEEQP